MKWSCVAPAATRRFQSRLDRKLRSENQETVLAVGAHLKNTVALKIDNNVFVSQHIGDLETKQAYYRVSNIRRGSPRLYEAKIDIVACDCIRIISRPNSRRSSDWRLARSTSFGARRRLHGRESRSNRPALGVAWDGTGYGLDGTIWGGEFLLVKGEGSFERVAHFRQFRLPGGDPAIKEPRRSALGLLYEIFGDGAWDFPPLVADFSEQEKSLLRQILEKQINAPLTSSVGRLFDAVARWSDCGRPPVLKDKPQWNWNSHGRATCGMRIHLW